MAAVLNRRQSIYDSSCRREQEYRALVVGNTCYQFLLSVSSKAPSPTPTFVRTIVNTPSSNNYNNNYIHFNVLLSVLVHLFFATILLQFLPLSCSAKYQE